MAWDETTKADAIQKYLDSEPTPENSMEIVQEIATELGESPNRIRMTLVQAGKYVKKDATKSSASASGSKASGDKAPRVSKDDAQKALVAAIEEAGAEADSEIIAKMTGKAAQYFAAVIAKINAGDE